MRIQARLLPGHGPGYNAPGRAVTALAQDVWCVEHEPARRQRLQALAPGGLAA